MQNYWFESLPESCPPADSEKCQGIYYRVAIGNPAQSEDFFSHAENGAYPPTQNGLIHPQLLLKWP